MSVYGYREFVRILWADQADQAAGAGNGEDMVAAAGHGQGCQGNNSHLSDNSHLTDLFKDLYKYKCEASGGKSNHLYSTHRVSKSD